MKNAVRILVLALGASTAFAGFPSTESYLPAVGRVTGAGGAEFYTTIWVTNLTGAPVSFTFAFLKGGQANPNPASFGDTLSPGQTKTYENVVGEKLGLSSALGAARVTATGEVLVAERIYDQAPGADLGNTEGLFFAGVPKSFSISLGQSASIQGVDQGSTEDFRYNFALVETGGGSPTVNVQLYDGDGTLLGQKAYAMQPYEQIQPNVADIVSSVSTTNARITATVTGGTGSVLLAGAQVANASQDSSGFEMSFRDQLLGGGGAGGGLTAVVHDGTLLGSGTAATPLGVNPASVVTSLNSLTGAVTLSAGSNVTLGKSGSTITISSAGGGGGGTGGLTEVSHDDTLTGNGTSGSPLGAHVPLILTTSEGSAIGGTTTADDFSAVFGQATTGDGIVGISDSGSGVAGQSTSGYGVFASTQNYVAIGATNNDSISPTISATNSGTGNGIDVTAGGHGLYVTAGADGILATTSGASRAGVSGHNTGGGDGVYGQSSGNAGYFSGNLTVTGNSNVMGTKHFIEPHPTDPSKEIRFTSLEGPESGTYFRGTGMIAGGFARIAIPEAFRLVTSREGLTVIVSPVGSPAVLTVMKQSLDEIVIQGSSDVKFNYMVNGVRAGFENEPAIVDNVDFVPRSKRDSGLSERVPPEVFRRLVENGILNADGSVNQATARRMGWDHRRGWKQTADR